MNTRDSRIRKWAVSYQWSQTERGTAIVIAESGEAARELVKQKLPGIHHTTGASEVEHDFTVWEK